MENLKCPFCGKETPRVLSRCKHCGERLPKIQEVNTSEVFQIRKRSKFTSFYLWFCLVLNILFGIAYFFTIFTRKGLWTANDPMFTRIYGFVSSAILFCGFLSLICWKKIGFYIIIIMGIFNQIIYIISVILGDPISIYTFSPILSIMVLYIVLLIRRDGKTCWEQLS